MIERCRRAVAWITQHASTLGIDPCALHLAGCSAGAHLAAMTALTDWSRYGLTAPPLRSVTLMSGVFDLRPLPLTYVNDAVGMSAEEALLNSPQLLIDASQAPIPPTLVVWGNNETGEFIRQSREFASALGRKGIEVHAEEIAGRNHFDLIFDLGDARTRFGALILERLGVARGATAEQGAK
jgi:arylformamidase